MLQAGRDRVGAGDDIQPQVLDDLLAHQQVGHPEGGDHRAGEQRQKQHGDTDRAGTVESDHRRRGRSMGGGPSRM